MASPAEKQGRAWGSGSAQDEIKTGNTDNRPLDPRVKSRIGKAADDFNKGYSKGYQDTLRSDAVDKMQSVYSDTALASALHEMNTADTLPQASPNPYVPPSKVGK